MLDIMKKIINTYSIVLEELSVYRFQFLDTKKVTKTLEIKIR